VAEVHLFWLCAAPLILVHARRALAPGATRRDRIRLGVLVALTLCHVYRSPISHAPGWTTLAGLWR
jgi:hypothetical protein